MKYSTNYNMNKPELNEQYRLSHWNENTDIIDTELKRNADNISTETTRATSAETALQNLTNSAFKTTLFNFCYPIGVTYVQYPQQESPNVLFAGTDSVWQVIDYGGAFFRAQGGNAETFSEKTDDLKLQSDCIKETTVSVSGGSHSHGGQTGNVTGSGTTWEHNHPINKTGANAGRNDSGYLTVADHQSDFTGTINSFNANLQHTHSIPDSGNLTMTGTIGAENTETRPKNYTIRVWKRIA